MTAADAHAGSEELQFDRVASDAPAAEQTSRQPAVACAICSTPIHTDYYHVNEKAVCERCRDAVAALGTAPRGWRPLGRATALGIGAAIAGAVVYYAVIAITDFEIGIVAILIGYMVGWAVRKGTAGRGGRRFQILAAVLTYWSVGLAYTPLAFKGENGHETEKPAAAVADSTRAPVADSATASTPASVPASSHDSAKVLAAGASDRKAGHKSLLFALGALFVFVFALPVIAIVGSLPAGLLSAFIIFIGIRQAWRMTAAPSLQLSGPYRVGADASAAAG